MCGILIGNMYAPNGNPWPGPKFDYKLAWLDGLKIHAQELLDSGLPAILIGDYNVIPTDMDVYKPERWAKDALVRAAGAGEISRSWSRKAGPTRSASFIPNERIYTFWHYWRNSFERDAGIRIDHALLSPEPREEAQGRGRRPHSARLGEDQRPRADVGRGGGVLETVAASTFAKASVDGLRRCIGLAAEASGEDGAGCRSRTRDLRFTKPLLYQLS